MNFSTQPNLFWQQWPALSPLMKALTLLGNEQFFLLLLPLVYLCIDRRAGLRLGCIVVLGDALNSIFKVAFAQPRPYWIDGRVQAWTTDTSYGFPSSHAQNATAVWCWVAMQIRRPWAWLVAAVLAVGIALSRVFLGVHFVADVIGGALIGLVFLALFVRGEPGATAWWKRQSLVSQIGAATISAAALLLLFFAARNFSASTRDVPMLVPYDNVAGSAKAIVARAGAWWGLLVGAALAARMARFEVDGGVLLRLLRFVVAVLGVALCWLGLARVFPKSPDNLELAFRFVRYALLSLWIIVAAPALFLKIGWLSNRKLPPSPSSDQSTRSA